MTPQFPPSHEMPKTRSKLPWIVGGAAGLILVFSACAVPASNDAVGAAEGASPTAVTGAAEASSESSTLAFGESHTWRGGETITVSAPNEYTDPDPFLAAPEGKRYVSVDVTIHNGGDSEYQVMQATLTAQHNGRVAQENYMAGDLLPDVMLPPGGDVTFTSVYEVGTDPGELRISVQPNAFASDTVYFTGEF